MFQRLIDLRSGIVFELGKWINKDVTIHLHEAAPDHKTASAGHISFLANAKHRWPKDGILAKIIFVNNFWITLQRSDNKQNQSEPLDKITLSFDDTNDRLKIIVSY